jgi:DNA polymerase-1
MLAVDAWCSTQQGAARLIMQVHDELILEVRTEALENTRERVCALMSGAAELAVPLKVDSGSGANWDQAH